MLLAEDIDDLAASVLEGVQGMGKVTDVSFPYQNVMFPRFMEKGKIPTDKEGDIVGTKMTFRVDTAQSTSFRYTGLFDSNNEGRTTGLQTGSVSLTKMDVSTHYDVDEDYFNGKTPYQVINHIKRLIRKEEMGFAKGCEEGMFNMPAGPNDRPLALLGLPYWLVLDTTSTTPDFTGGNPSGHTAGCAGLSSSDIAAWDNLTWGYTAINMDFVENLHTSFFMTNFMAPVPFAENNTGNKGWFFCTTLGMTNKLRRFLASMNQNYGSDVMGSKGVPLNGQDIEPCSYLTQTSTNDIMYAVNLAHLGIKAPPGKEGKWLPPKQRPDAYSVRDLFRPAWFQFWCDDRRQAGFVCARQ